MSISFSTLEIVTSERTNSARLIFTCVITVESDGDIQGLIWLHLPDPVILLPISISRKYKFDFAIGSCKKRRGSIIEIRKGSFYRSLSYFAFVSSFKLFLDYLSNKRCLNYLLQFLRQTASRLNNH